MGGLRLQHTKVGVGGLLARLGTAVLVAVLATALCTVRAHASESVTIHVFAFNEMDAILLESNGHFGIVDSGEDSTYPTGTDSRYPARQGITRGQGVEDEVISTLRRLGVTQGNLDFYIGTHPHSDHIGSAQQVIEAFHPKRVYIPEYKDAYIYDQSRLWDNQYVYDRLVAAATTTGATLITTLDPSAPIDPGTAGKSAQTTDDEHASSSTGTGLTGNPNFTLGSATINIKNYELSTHPRANGRYADANELSWGVLVKADGHSAFLSGDINNTRGDEGRLASELGHVDVLKMGHHGWSGSNTPGYLRALSPQIALQTGKFYRLPEDVYETLNALRTQYYPVDVVTASGYSLMTVTFVNGQIGTRLINDPDKVFLLPNYAGTCAYAYRNGVLATAEEVAAHRGALTLADGSSRPGSYAGSIATKDGIVRSDAIRDGWMASGGTWYHFKSYLVQTGWLASDGAWYYLDPGSGAMATGWRAIGGSWYWFDAAGAMVSGGWRHIAGTWYWFDGSGVMATGWLRQGSTWYYLDPASGAMATGWKNVGGSWYWFNASGAMYANGWKDLNGSWYHFDASGAMDTGWHRIGGAWYWFDSSGAMATGWLRLGGTWYLFHDSGAMATGWVQDEGVWYYLSGSGAMCTGWLRLGDTWYYLDPASGAMHTGWLEDGDGSWYWLSASGAMAHDTSVSINGTRYAFDGSGRCLL